MQSASLGAVVWEKFSSEDGIFEAEFPCKAAKSIQESNSKLIRRTYSCLGEGTQYQIEETVPTKEGKANAEKRSKPTLDSLEKKFLDWFKKAELKASSKQYTKGSYQVLEIHGTGAKKVSMAFYQGPRGAIHLVVTGLANQTVDIDRATRSL